MWYFLYFYVAQLGVIFVQYNLSLGLSATRIKTDLSYEPLSDLIHGITENGFMHASGPVHAKHPIRYINC